MNRVIFLIDGFNLYHSIIAIKKVHNVTVKWLNIHSLCQSCLHIIGSKATIEKIYYFSAYAYHLNDPDIIQRHSDYIECLKSTGIEPILGRFKTRDINCSLCRRWFIKHEEKETDIAIAAKLLEVLAKGKCDTAVLVTGDTDLIPAIKTANLLYPNCNVLCAFPFRRKNEELKAVAPNSFKLHLNRYINNQFLNPVNLPNGQVIYKPASW